MDALFVQAFCPLSDVTFVLEFRSPCFFLSPLMIIHSVYQRFQPIAVLDPTFLFTITLENCQCSVRAYPILLPLPLSPSQTARPLPAERPGRLRGEGRGGVIGTEAYRRDEATRANPRDGAPSGARVRRHASGRVRERYVAYHARASCGWRESAWCRSRVYVLHGRLCNTKHYAASIFSFLD